MTERSEVACARFGIPINRAALNHYLGSFDAWNLSEHHRELELVANDDLSVATLRQATRSLRICGR